MNSEKTDGPRIRGSLLQLQSLEQGTQAGSDLFALRQLEGYFHNLFRRSIFFKGFHAQTELSVLDCDDLDLNLVAFFQNFRRSLDPAVHDLGDMEQSAQTFAEVDKCAVILDCLYGSFCYKAGLDVRNPCPALLGFFLAKDLFRGENEFAAFFLGGDDARFDALAEPVVQVVFLNVAKAELGCVSLLSFRLLRRSQAASVAASFMERRM